MTGWARRAAASRAIRDQDEPGAAAWQAALRWQARGKVRRAVLTVLGYQGSRWVTGYAESSVTERSIAA